MKDETVEIIRNLLTYQARTAQERLETAKPVAEGLEAEAQRKPGDKEIQEQAALWSWRANYAANRAKMYTAALEDFEENLGK